MNFSWLGCELHTYYANSMRGSLFSGFLTMAGFLFSAHTWIIVHLKKEVYEHKANLKRVRDSRTITPTFSLYGGLKNLSRLLIISVVACLVAAVSQLTIGLWPYNVSAVVCIGFAVVAILMLCFSMGIMIVNLKQWFGDLEAMSEEVIAAAEKESKK